MRREDIEFDAEGVTLRGWLYRPDAADPDHPVPGIVMAHGFSAVKEMGSDRYAEVFAAANLAVLTYDNRNFGASDGRPRQEIDPWAQAQDYRHAITWLQQQAGIDPDRIGIWGTSLSGGHVLVVAAIDRRVKCAVAQVPFISGHETLVRRMSGARLARLRERFDADRRARFRGEPPAMIPVVTTEPEGDAASPSREAWDWFTRTAREHAPAWQNAVTLRSLEMFGEYEPGTYIGWISPTPLLMIVATRDQSVPTDVALRAFQQALPPKRLVLLEGSHFDAYDRLFETTSAAARDWFVRYLADRSHADGAHAISDS